MDARVELPGILRRGIFSIDLFYLPSGLLLMCAAITGDFFSLSRCDFALTHDEATWLAERIVDAVPDTLLQFLVAKGNRPQVTARYAWEDPDVAVATGRVRNALDEARRFVVALHGAALLYNVLLAERAGKLGLLEHEQRRDHYAAQLEEWRREVESSDLGGWDLNQL